MNKTQIRKAIRHPLQREFILNKVYQGNHENMEKDYGKMGQLETEEEQAEAESTVTEEQAGA